MNRDGVVWLRQEYAGGSIEYINIDKILSFKSLSKEACHNHNTAFPGILIRFENKEQYLGSQTIEQFKKEIDKAIKDHYDNIANNALLGDDK